MSTPSATLYAALDELSDQLDRPTVMELIEVYTENSATQILKIDQAAALGDLKEISAQAHSLKSSSANMGALELSQVCLQLEKAKIVDASVLVWVKSARTLWEQAVIAMKEWKADKSA